MKAKSEMFASQDEDDKITFILFPAGVVYNKFKMSNAQHRARLLPRTSSLEQPHVTSHSSRLQMPKCCIME